MIQKNLDKKHLRFSSNIEYWSHWAQQQDNLLTEKQNEN